MQQSSFSRPTGSTIYVRPPPSRGTDGFHHPSNESELVDLVRMACREGRRLRVRGAAHSVASAIYTDGRPSRDHVDVMLDRYVGVRFDDARMRVTVQAGCHLGRDPRDPTRTSTWESSLLAQLDERGWALPDLGGVAHQTVAGFFSTGSNGGTVAHSIAASVVALRIIDGRGAIHELVRGVDERFDAAACSMGLLGVISTVTLQCEPRYDVIGEEVATAERRGPCDPFADGDAGLAGYLRSTEYARLMWWPQLGVRRIAWWQARRMQPGDYGATTGARGALRPKPYSAFGDGVGHPRLGDALNLAAQGAAGAFYDVLAQGERARTALLRRRPSTRDAVEGVRAAFSSLVLPSIIRGFVPTGVPQVFWDSWCRALPMDEQMSESSLPTEFTEIWVPLDRAGEVMRALRAHYDRNGYDATGNFLCELYAAPATDGWLHPGYGRDSLRVDLFWFARNPGDPARSYFVQFWELLRPFDYRLHWGKHLPADPALGHRYLRQRYARWDDFMALRSEHDPSGVFLTPYWQISLGCNRD